VGQDTAKQSVGKPRMHWLNWTATLHLAVAKLANT